MTPTHSYRMMKIIVVDMNQFNCNIRLVIRLFCGTNVQPISSRNVNHHLVKSHDKMFMCVCVCERERERERKREGERIDNNINHY